MQSTSSPGSRRNTRPSASGPKRTATSSRTADLTSAGRKGTAKGAPAGDAGAKRRAERKAANRRNNWIAGLIAISVTVAVSAAGAGVYSEYSQRELQIAHKKATLFKLQKQEENGRRRLTQLKSPRGRADLLVNSGYIKPGDRVLLFPRTEAEKKAAAEPANDLVPQEPAEKPGFLSRLRSAWHGFTSPVGVTTSH
jgi:hypothetical protein